MVDFDENTILLNGAFDLPYWSTPIFKTKKSGVGVGPWDRVKWRFY